MHFNPVTYLDAIGVVVADIGRAAAFYRLLGLDFPDVTPDTHHLEATIPGGLRVMLDSEAVALQLDPAWVRPTSQSMALAFRCATPADVDARHAALVAAGHASAAAPWDAFWGQRYAQVFDPDGHRVDLFAPL